MRAHAAPPIVGARRRMRSSRRPSDRRVDRDWVGRRSSPGQDARHGHRSLGHLATRDRGPRSAKARRRPAASPPPLGPPRFGPPPFGPLPLGPPPLGPSPARRGSARRRSARRRSARRRSAHRRPAAVRPTAVRPIAGPPPFGPPPFGPSPARRRSAHRRSAHRRPAAVCVRYSWDGHSATSSLYRDVCGEVPTLRNGRQEPENVGSRSIPMPNSHPMGIWPEPRPTRLGPWSLGHLATRDRGPRSARRVSRPGGRTRRCGRSPAPSRDRDRGSWRSRWCRRRGGRW